MKRILSVALLGAGIAVLAGCPVYPDNPSDYRVCDGHECYDCPDNFYSTACLPWQCASDYDCPSPYSCVYPGAYCGIPGATVDAGPAPTGDCSTTGCPAGFVCELVGGVVACVAPGPTPDASVPDTSVPPPDAGPDSGFSGCQVDSDCASTAGARCIDGVCVAPINQCFDGTQCPSGDQCVGGVCTPTCSVADGSAGRSCPTGYTCDPNGDCTGNPTPCASGGTACPGGTVCAQNHCVAPCGDAGACPAAEVCVQGGCVPNGNPTFTCNANTDCASGSLCLHHSCYIGCDPDAGTACKQADQFPVCTAVATSTGTVHVCGTGTNLGSQCAPGGKQCTAPGAVCIDGYCR